MHSNNFCNNQSSSRPMINIIVNYFKMKGKSWAVAKNEGNSLIMVLRDYGNVYKFGVFNSECEDKYPLLHPYDLYENYERDSETKSEYLERL